MRIRLTSEAAYRDLSKAARRRAVLEKILSRSRAVGWTRQELAEALGWPINSVTGRVTELLTAGYIETAPFCRKNPFSGKACGVVRVKEKQIQAA
jgi:CRP-like cAMP-binding protein